MTVLSSSMFNSQYMRFVPTLMDSGWAWKNQNPSIYRFTFFEGDQFIKKAIDEFNQNNKYKFTIKVESTYNQLIIQRYKRGFMPLFFLH